MSLIEKLKRNIKGYSDEGFKKIYPYCNKFIVFTKKQVLEACKSMNFKKATSWDYIPGTARP